MSGARQRQLVLLMLATTLLLAVVLPRMGDAQESTPGADPAAVPDLVIRGEEIYATTCIACHQAGGEGASVVGVGGIPALANNPLVTLEDPAPVVQTILNGRAGMPNFRSYSDEDIAAVASYIRQTWGNEAAPVDPALVAEIRAQFQVSPPPEATPVSTEIVGSLAPSAAAATPSGPESSPDVPGGAESGGITPIPTIGQ